MILVGHELSQQVVYNVLWVEHLRLKLQAVKMQVECDREQLMETCFAQYYKD